MNDDPKMPEPAHPATYYCNKCGHYGPTGPAHANCNYNAVQYGPHYSAEQLLAYAQALAAARVAQELERWRALLEARAAGCERAAENTEDPKFDLMARVLMSVREDGSVASNVRSSCQQPPETGNNQ